MNPSFHDVIAASDAERRDLFLGTAARLGTAVQNVEKDFWVCWTLDALFNGLAVGGPRLLFKGGTSLSKAFGLISRFSEDAAGLIVSLYAGAQLTSLGNLVGTGPVLLGVMAVPFTVFATVGVANAFNLSDGMDGLAGGLAMITAAFLAVAAYLSGSSETLVLLLILSGALAGFLCFTCAYPGSVMPRSSWAIRAA